jgi:hypothetical protein
MIPTNIIPEVITVTIDTATATFPFILYNYVNKNGVFSQISSSNISKGATAE